MTLICGAKHCLVLILYFVSEVFTIPYQLNENYFCCGRKVIPEHHMSRDHAGGWGSPLITCGVMKPLKNNVHANSLVPADMSICTVTLVSSLVVSSQSQH